MQLSHVSHMIDLFALSYCLQDTLKACLKGLTSVRWYLLHQVLCSTFCLRISSSFTNAKLSLNAAPLTSVDQHHWRIWAIVYVSQCLHEVGWNYYPYFTDGQVQAQKLIWPTFQT